MRHITGGNTEIQHVHIINVDRELLRVHVEVFHIPHFAFLTVIAQIVSTLRFHIQSTLKSSNTFV